MTLLIMQHATILLGILTVSYSLGLMVYFRQFREPVSAAFSWMLLGEAFTGAIFLWFTALSWSVSGTDWINPHVRVALRFLAFFITAATSLHLSLVIKRIRHS